MRISDWSSDVCSSDLHVPGQRTERVPEGHPQASHHAGTGDELLGAGHRRHRGLSFGAEEVSRAMTRSASLLAIALASALVLAGCSGSHTPRPGERRVGTVGVSTCRSRWSPYK